MNKHQHSMDNLLLKQTSLLLNVLYCEQPISNLMYDLCNRTVLVNVLFQETSFVTLTFIEHLL